MTRLQVYLRPHEHAALLEAAGADRLAPSRYARRLMLAALRSSNRVAAAPDRPTSADPALPHTKGRQLGVRVPGPVFAALEAVARDHGQTCAGWTAALLAHYLLDQPMLRHDESAALREATRQLAAVGVLLNQVARALNAQRRATGTADARALPRDLIDRCAAQIQSTTDAAHRLMSASRQVYRYADEIGSRGETAKVQHA
jgi:hypothetical protein